MIVIMSQVPAPLSGAVPADSEVVAKPERRVSTAEPKKRILAQADAAVEKGDRAKRLRREGLYSSTRAGWRRERESALDKGFSQKRGPEPKSNPLVGENEELRRQNKQWEEELRKAELIIEIQKSGDAAGQTTASDPGKRELLRKAVQDLGRSVGSKRACDERSVSRASYDRQRPGSLCPPAVDRPRSSARRLREEERAAALACLQEERFQDCSPAQV
jgi:hypothetical protein